MVDLLKALTLALVMGGGLWFNAASQCINNNINISTETPPTKRMRYFAAGELLQQVIIPEMSFKCHGNITSWSALTVVNQDEQFLMYLTYELTFTVWRPREGNIYDLVGQNEIEYEGTELMNGITQIDNSSGQIQSNIGYYRLNMKEPKEQITFQPGDVVGWTISRTVQNTNTQFSVVYEQVNALNTQAVHLILLQSNTRNTYCSVLQCDSTRNISFVIPYISVQYDEDIRPNAGSTQTRPMCFERDQFQCPDDNSTDNITTSTLGVTLLCPGVNCPTAEPTNPLIYYIAAGSTAIVFVFLLLIVLMGVILHQIMCRGALKRDTLQENPIYESADLFQLTNLEENNKTNILVKPDGIGHSKINMTRDMNDGQCYASAYEINGNIHLYQELPEAKSRARSRSLAMSNEAIHPKPHLPLRMAMSSASVLRCHYTMPNNHTAPYSEVNKNPSRNGTPYLKPSLSSIRSKSKAQSYPNLDSRHSAISLLQTPETTSPRSAMDDGTFIVPNALERDNLEKMGSSDQIYSKLVHFHFPKDAVPVDNMAPYLIPPSSTNELYDQLAKKNYREIQRKHISTTEYIGGGHFGKVHKGYWKVPGGEIQVAIKTLNPKSPSDDVVKFLKEVAIMGQFLHPNVVKLLGVVTVGEPMMIVLELMPGGDLSHYLSKLRYQPSSISNDLPAVLLNFCRQVGFGMNYLANKGFVHRDLAARNILVTDDKTCKIGDFGMARDLEQDVIYFSKGGAIPLKWTAPESLKYHQFSSASDVWSYGMLLFEIWSLGKKPFEGMLTKRVIEQVHTGYCQPPPPGCPRAIYQLMVQCWHTDPEQRSTFSNICSYLDSSMDASLLMWSTSDLNTLPQAAVLGAPLLEAKKLYLDLQYTHSTV